MNRARAWLIAYDISNPRRLRRVHRLLCRHAVPVQYSVFLFLDSPARMGQLISRLETLIDPREDDIRGYALPTTVELEVIGRGRLPPEVALNVPGAAGWQRLLTAPGGDDSADPPE